MRDFTTSNGKREALVFYYKNLFFVSLSWPYVS